MKNRLIRIFSILLITVFLSVMFFSERVYALDINLKDIKVSFIKEIENWINNYPRSMFDYRSSNDVLLNI